MGNLVNTSGQVQTFSKSKLEQAESVRASDQMSILPRL